MAAKQQHLQGWKEIAGWLGRDERTAKRWEKQRGLPVRRTPGSGRANVFCLVPELEAWLISAGPEPAPPPADPPAVLAELPPATPPALEPEPDPPAIPQLALDPAPPPPLASPRAPVQHRWIALAAVLLLAILLPLTSFFVHHRAPAPEHVASPAVHEMTLQAGYLTEQRTPASLAEARQKLQTAIHLDPNFPAAYAGLAQTLLLLREYSNYPSQQAYQQAEAAANHALALDPNLADAHTALGFIDFFFHWQPLTAEQQFRTALRLDPQSGVAHHWFGSMLLHQGRYDEALVQLDQARALQPSSPAILATTVMVLGLGGHRPAALELAHTTLALQPENACMHRALATISLQQPRDIPTYLTELRQFANISHDRHTLDLLNAGEPAFHSGNEPALWRAMLAREQKLSPGPTVGTAQFQAALGEEGPAIHDLSLLADRRDPAMIGLAMDPMFSDLRSSGRLRSVALRMHLDLRYGDQLVALSNTAAAGPDLP